MSRWRLDIDESAIYCGDRLVARLETGDSNDAWREATRLGAEMVQSTTQCDQLSEALRRLRQWGGMPPEGQYSATIAHPVCTWIDAGMIGELPALPTWERPNDRS